MDRFLQLITHKAHLDENIILAHNITDLQITHKQLLQFDITKMILQSNPT